MAKQISASLRAFKAKISGLTPYSQSRMVGEPKSTDEDWDAYEARTWRKKMHTMRVGDEERVSIPSAALSQALAAYAKLKSERIPGKGMKTWSAPFLTGVRVFDDVPTSATVADVYSETNMCDSQGKKGSSGGVRVARTFPCIGRGWTAEPVFLIVDDSITIDQFQKYLIGAGMQIGIGRWRMQNGGNKGCFQVLSVEEIDPKDAIGF